MDGRKPTGRHPDKALSALRVKALDKPGRYADGNGLYLIVDPSGAKRWVLRTARWLRLGSGPSLIAGWHATAAIRSPRSAEST
ncbi:MAG: Arm DNA-binding domain-containing protein [Bauldia sp.]